MDAAKRVARMRAYVIRTTPDTFYYEVPWRPAANTYEYTAYVEALRVWHTRMGQKHFGKNTQIEMRQDINIDRKCYVVTGKVVFLKPLTRAEMTLELSEQIQEGSLSVNSARKMLGYQEFL